MPVYDTKTAAKHSLIGKAQKKLPPIVQVLLENMFPPEELPMLTPMNVTVPPGTRHIATRLPGYVGARGANKALSHGDSVVPPPTTATDVIEEALKSFASKKGSIDALMQKLGTKDFGKR